MYANTSDDDIDQEFTEKRRFTNSNKRIKHSRSREVVQTEQNSSKKHKVADVKEGLRERSSLGLRERSSLSSSTKEGFKGNVVPFWVDVMNQQLFDTITAIILSRPAVSRHQTEIFEHSSALIFQNQAGLFVNDMMSPNERVSSLQRQLSRFSECMIAKNGLETTLQVFKKCHLDFDQVPIETFLSTWSNHMSQYPHKWNEIERRLYTIVDNEWKQYSALLERFTHHHYNDYTVVKAKLGDYFPSLLRLVDLCSKENVAFARVPKQLFLSGHLCLPHLGITANTLNGKQTKDILRRFKHCKTQNESIQNLTVSSLHSSIIACIHATWHESAKQCYTALAHVCIDKFTHLQSTVQTLATLTPTKLHIVSLLMANNTKYIYSNWTQHLNSYVSKIVEEWDTLSLDEKNDTFDSFVKNSELGSDINLEQEAQSSKSQYEKEFEKQNKGLKQQIVTSQDLLESIKILMDKENSMYDHSKDTTFQTIALDRPWTWDKSLLSLSKEYLDYDAKHMFDVVSEDNHSDEDRPSTEDNNNSRQDHSDNDDNNNKNITGNKRRDSKKHKHLEKYKNTEAVDMEDMLNDSEDDKQHIPHEEGFKGNVVPLREEKKLIDDIKALLNERDTFTNVFGALDVDQKYIYRLRLPSGLRNMFSEISRVKEECTNNKDYNEIESINENMIQGLNVRYHDLYMAHHIKMWIDCAQDAKQFLQNCINICRIQNVDTTSNYSNIDSILKTHIDSISPDHVKQLNDKNHRLHFSLSICKIVNEHSKMIKYRLIEETEKIVKQTIHFLFQTDKLNLTQHYRKYISSKLVSTFAIKCSHWIDGELAMIAANLSSKTIMKDLNFFNKLLPKYTDIVALLHQTCLHGVICTHKMTFGPEQKTEVYTGTPTMVVSTWYDKATNNIYLRQDIESLVNKMLSEVTQHDLRISLTSEPTCGNDKWTTMKETILQYKSSIGWAHEYTNLNKLMLAQYIYKPSQIALSEITESMTFQDFLKKVLYTILFISWYTHLYDCVR